MFDTPIAALEQQLSGNGKKSRRDATKADIIRREQNALTPLQLAQETKNKENIIELEPKATNTNSKKLKYEDIKDLTPEELYEMIYGIRCFLQALFGKSCKVFLENVASPNWRKLQSLGWQLSCQPHSHCRPYLVVTV